jgi:eukaryotic-like serine/threonine-protein kinase
VTLGRPGELINKRYLLRRLLGTGGFGEVWEAIDQHRSYEPSLPPHVIALKLIRTHDHGEVWLEASRLTALESDHILKVNNADRVVDVLYLDTALAECSLERRSEPFGVEPGLAVEWVRSALRGLELCHQHRLLHRDVKPHNVFLTPSGDAKLGDFGVAAPMDKNGNARPGGDQRIWAPEFFTGNLASVQSDIYASACTLYALVGGRLPFDGFTDVADLADAVVNGAYTPIRDVAPHVSQALADKIRKGMALDPDDRFRTAAEFDRALALPIRPRRFTPVPPHPGHVRCWRVTGGGREVRVCVLPGATAQRVTVETHYAQSGNRLTPFCFGTTAAALPVRLRSVFNDLRNRR